MASERLEECGLVVDCTPPLARSYVGCFPTSIVYIRDVSVKCNVVGKHNDSRFVMLTSNVVWVESSLLTGYALRVDRPSDDSVYRCKESLLQSGWPSLTFEQKIILQHDCMHLMNASLIDAEHVLQFMNTMWHQVRFTSGEARAKWYRVLSEALWCDVFQNNRGDVCVSSLEDGLLEDERAVHKKLGTIGFSVVLRHTEFWTNVICIFKYNGMVYMSSPRQLTSTSSSLLQDPIDRPMILYRNQDNEKKMLTHIVSYSSKSHEVFNVTPIRKRKLCDIVHRNRTVGRASLSEQFESASSGARLLMLLSKEKSASGS